MPVTIDNLPSSGSLTGSEFVPLVQNGQTYKTTVDSIRSSGGSITDVTFEELYDKVVNSQLTPLAWYRLLDYQSANFLNGFQTANNNPTPINPNFNPHEIHYGDTEVLLLNALTSSELSPIGFSETHINDIVKYNPLVKDISLSLEIYNNNTLPNGQTVEGFDLQWDGTNVYFNLPSGYPILFGQPLYLYFNGDGYDVDVSYASVKPGDNTDDGNTFLINILPDGYKVILPTFTEQDYLNYNVNSLYIHSYYSLGYATGQIIRRQDLNKNIDCPLDFRGFKYRRFECEILGLITSFNNTTSVPSASDGTYTLTNLSANGTSGYNAGFIVTIKSGTVNSIILKNPGRLFVSGDTITIDGTQIGGTSGTDNIQITVVNVNSNVNYWGIGDVFNGATTTGNYQDYPIFNINNTYNVVFKYSGNFSNWTFDNFVFLGVCSFNTIGYTFFNNTIIDPSNNNIENNFYGNSISGFQDNNIGSYFQNNIIASSFYNNNINGGFSYNIIGYGFNFNTIGYNLYYNIIGNYFYNNTIRGNFRYNNITNNFQNNNIGNDFYNNNVNDSFQRNNIGVNFSSNSIGNNFQDNNIGSNSYNNIIGDYFQYNKIGNSFINNTIGRNLSSNIIGNYFIQNTIGDDFVTNQIMDGFNLNTIGNQFISNIINQVFQHNIIGFHFTNNFITCIISEVDFSGASVVYSNMSCNLFLRGDGQTQLSYVNGENTVVYTLINE